MDSELVFRFPARFLTQIAKDLKSVPSKKEWTFKTKSGKIILVEKKKVGTANVLDFTEDTSCNLDTST